MSEKNSDDLSRQVVENWDRGLRFRRRGYWGGGPPFYSSKVEAKTLLLFVIVVFAVFSIFYDLLDIDNYEKFDKKTTGIIVSVEDKGFSLFGKNVEVSYMINGVNYRGTCKVSGDYKANVGKSVRIAYKSGRPLKFCIDNTGYNANTGSFFEKSLWKYVVLIVGIVLILCRDGKKKE